MQNRPGRATANFQVWVVTENSLLRQGFLALCYDMVFCVVTRSSGQAHDPVWERATGRARAIELFGSVSRLGPSCRDTGPKRAMSR